MADEIEEPVTPGYTPPTYELRNPRFSLADHSIIDCEYNHPDYGWIPFTASPNDPVEHGRTIYQLALAMGPADYVAPALTQDDYKNAVQALVDNTAIARNYTDGNSCASYAGDTVVPQWGLEGAAFKAWRSTVWAYVFNQLYAVLNGQRPQPTVEELLAELPAMTWPEPAA